jgi:hypothetical protein
MHRSQRNGFYSILPLLVSLVIGNSRIPPDLVDFRSDPRASIASYAAVKVNPSQADKAVNAFL